MECICYYSGLFGEIQDGVGNAGDKSIFSADHRNVFTKSLTDFSNSCKVKGSGKAIGMLTKCMKGKVWVYETADF